MLMSKPSQIAPAPMLHVAAHKARDPALFSRDVAEFAGGLATAGPVALRLALGLDLGTSAGYAFTYYDPGRTFDPRTAFVAMGQWDLSAGAYDSGAIRFALLDRPRTGPPEPPAPRPRCDKGGAPARTSRIR